MYMYKYLNIIIYNSYKHRVFKLYTCSMHGVDKLSTVDYILYTKTNNGKTVDKKIIMVKQYIIAIATGYIHSCLL